MNLTVTHTGSDVNKGSEKEGIGGRADGPKPRLIHKWAHAHSLRSISSL